MPCIPFINQIPGCSRGRDHFGTKGYFPFVRILQCFLSFLFNKDNNEDNRNNNNYLVGGGVHSDCEVVGVLERIARTLCRRKRLLTSMKEKR